LNLCHFLSCLIYKRSFLAEKSEMFIESCCRLYFKDNRKHDCRGSVSRLAITKNKSLVNETGKLKWVASFGVGNYALTLSMKRLTIIMSILTADSLRQKHRPSRTAFRSFIRMTPNPTVFMINSFVVGFFVC